MLKHIKKLPTMPILATLGSWSVITTIMATGSVIYVWWILGADIPNDRELRREYLSALLRNYRQTRPVSLPDHHEEHWVPTGRRLVTRSFISRDELVQAVMEFGAFRWPPRRYLDD